MSNDTLQGAFAKLPFAESRRNFVEIITSDENHEGSCPGVLHGTPKNMSFLNEINMTLLLALIHYFFRVLIRIMWHSAIFFKNMFLALE